MTLKHDVLAQLHDLIGEGDFLVRSYSQEDEWEEEKSHISERRFRAFFTRSLAAISQIGGPKSQYMKTIPPIAPIDEMSRGNGPLLIGSILGSLEALQQDAQEGFLESLESRLRGNVHSDFLVQAEELLDQNYHVPAIVLIGGVLENHLQKLCTNRALEWNSKGSLNTYNDLLRTNDVYSLPVNRQISAIGDHRNNAAHGKGNLVTHNDVKDAFAYVRRFLAEYPS